MILQVQLDHMEEFTNIGLAKAICEAPCLTVADLEEIAEHLLLIVKHRRICAEKVKAERMGAGE